MNVGLAGLGFMGAAHMQAYSKLPNATVAAVCGRNERALSGDLSAIQGNIAGTAARYDFSSVRKYRDWRDLAADTGIDAVDICAPTDLHAPMAIAALEAGKHVFCEKPMALSIAGCDRMMDAAKRNKRVLMIGHVLRFWPDYEMLSDFVKSAPYGRVLSATFTRSCGLPDWSAWLPVEERSGGAVVDLLIHDIDQALALFGMPDRVSAKKLGSTDALTASLLYPDSALEVRVQGGWFPPGTPLSMGFQVRAERAELRLGPEGLSLNPPDPNLSPGRKQPEEIYRKELAYFISCCETGTTPSVCPPEESAMALKLALLMKESRAKGGEQIKCSD
jgi:predicted dehydrogenase